MNRIYVRSQEQFDAIPLDYRGTIIILAGNANFMVLKVKNDYPNAIIDAGASVRVFVYDSAMVHVRGSLTVDAYDSATVHAFGRATVHAYNHTKIFAYDASVVNAYSSSAVFACDHARICAYDSSKAIACDWATVYAFDGATTYAYGFSQVLDRTVGRNIVVEGDARIVYNPQTIEDYIRHYAIESDGKTCLLYKAVHKRDGKYFADWNGYEYKLGEIAAADDLDTNVNNDCGKGIHLSHLRYAFGFGRTWDDLAILELEAENDKIIVPLGNPGKVRTLKAKVIREVPRDEWNLFPKSVNFNHVNDISDVNA